MINKLIVRLQVLSGTRFYTRFHVLPLPVNKFTTWLFGHSSFNGYVGILLPVGLNKKG